MAETGEYPCPCCGFMVFARAPGSYDICPVCGWEDDLSQLRFPTSDGANPPLIECQRAYADRGSDGSGAALEELGLARDPGWRPLNCDTDPIEEAVPGIDYGTTYVEDGTAYYYWRTPHRPG